MSQQALYDTDFFLWTQEQAALLRDGKARDLDWANLAEEIESLGKSDRRALGSHLEQCPWNMAQVLDEDFFPEG